MPIPEATPERVEMLARQAAANRAAAKDGNRPKNYTSIENEVDDLPATPPPEDKK